MAYYIAQPTGVGTGADGEALDGAWLDAEIEIHAPDGGVGATYLHTLLDRPGDSAATLATATSQVATITPDVIGTLRVRTRVTTAAGVVSYTTRVIRVTQDSAGIEAANGVCPTAFGELPGEANYDGNERGYVERHERNWRAVSDRIAGATVLSHSGVTPVLTARPWAHVAIDHCDGTVAAATLPEVLPGEAGFVCLLATGTQQISVAPFAGNYLDEDVVARVYPRLSLVLFVSMFGDSWTSYVISSPTIMSSSGAALAHGTNRRTTGAAFTMPALVGSPWDVRAVVFLNLTGVDVTLTAAGANAFETGVASSTYVVPAARRSVTFLDDGSIWEPSAAP